VTWDSDHLSSDLPVQGISGPQCSIQLDWRWRWNEFRRDALEERAFTVQQAWPRKLSAPCESVRFLGRAEELRAGKFCNLVRGSVVIGVRVSQEQLAERDGVVGYAETVGERANNRVVLPGDVCVDHDHPIAVADRPAGDNLRSQTPQPIGQLHELQGQRGHISSLDAAGFDAIGHLTNLYEPLLISGDRACSP
jgi:hypothetical protein